MSGTDAGPGMSADSVLESQAVLLLQGTGPLT